jgi:hypothetical protein
VTSIRLVSRRGIAFIEVDSENASAVVDGLRGVQLKGRTMDVALEDRPGGRPGKRRGKGR